MRGFFLILLSIFIVLSPSALAETHAPSITCEYTDITPATRSAYRPQHENCYWCMPMNLDDEEAVWNMLTADITVVDLGQMKQTVLYAEPSTDSEPIAMVTGSSQGLHVLEQVDDEWSLVETYSTSFFDSKVKNFNAFVTGYIQTSKLKTVHVNQNIGVVVDKLTQRLYYFKDGHLETELVVSTGLYNEKQPYNETRSGDFLIISVTTGAITSDNLIGNYALRYNADDYLHEVLHVKNADGTKNFKSSEAKLGNRASHGCVRVQRLTNADGYNMSKIYKEIQSTTKKTKTNVRMVIWEDYAGRQVNMPSDDLTVYYNPKGGQNYHSTDTCPGVRKTYLPLTAITYGQLSTDFTSLTVCPYCQPVPRLQILEAINEEHLSFSPGDVMSYWPH